MKAVDPTYDAIGGSVLGKRMSDGTQKVARAFSTAHRRVEIKFEAPAAWLAKHNLDDKEKLKTDLMSCMGLRSTDTIVIEAESIDTTSVTLTRPHAWMIITSRDKGGITEDMWRTKLGYKFSLRREDIEVTYWPGSVIMRVDGPDWAIATLYMLVVVGDPGFKALCEGHDLTPMEAKFFDTVASSSPPSWTASAVSVSPPWRRTAVVAGAAAAAGVVVAAAAAARVQDSRLRAAASVLVAGLATSFVAVTSHIELSRQLAEKQVMHERQLLVQMQKLTARVEASEAALRAEHERPLGVVDTGMPFDVGYGKPMSLASLASADPTKLAGVSDTASVTPSDSASHAELRASHADDVEEGLLSISGDL